MIIHKTRLDCHKHCKIPFGTHVQAVDDNQNAKSTMKPRTLDCVCLRSTSNIQGGHDLLHLPTNKLINRGKVHPAPISKHVTAQVNNLGKVDGMPTGSKITSKHDDISCDSAWIAGVDYEEDEEDDDENECNEENDDDHIVMTQTMKN